MASDSSSHRETTIDHGSLPYIDTDFTERLRNHFNNQNEGSTFTIPQIITSLGLYHIIYDKNEKRRKSEEVKKIYDNIVSQLTKLVNKKDCVKKVRRGTYGPITSNGSSEGSSSYFSGLNNSGKKFNGSFRVNNGSSSKSSKHSMPQFNSDKFVELTGYRTDLLGSIDRLDITDEDLEKISTINYLEAPYYCHNLRIECSENLGNWEDIIPDTNEKAVIKCKGNQIRVKYKRPGLTAKEISYIYGVLRTRIKILIEFGFINKESVDSVKLTVRSLQIRNIHRWDAIEDKIEELGYIELEVLEKYYWLIMYRDEWGINREADIFNFDQPLETLFNSMYTAAGNFNNIQFQKIQNQRFTAITKEWMKETSKVGKEIEERVDLLDETITSVINAANGMSVAALDVKLETSQMNKDVKQMSHAVEEMLHETISSNEDADDWRVLQSLNFNELVKIAKNIDTKTVENKEKIEELVQNSLATGAISAIQVQKLSQFVEGSFSKNDEHNRSKIGSSSDKMGSFSEFSKTVRSKSVLKNVIKLQKWLVRNSSEKELKKSMKRYIKFIANNPGFSSKDIRIKLKKQNQFNSRILRYLELRGYIKNQGKKGQRGYSWHYVPKEERGN